MTKSIEVKPRLATLPPKAAGRPPGGGKWAAAVETVKTKPGRWWSVAQVDADKRRGLDSIGQQLKKKVPGLETAVRKVGGEAALYLKFEPKP